MTQNSGGTNTLNSKFYKTLSFCLILQTMCEKIVSLVPPNIRCIFLKIAENVRREFFHYELYFIIDLGPWMHGSIARSLDKLKDGDVLAGSDEAEGDSFSKVIPLVALFAGKKELNDVIEKAVRTTLNNDKSVS